MNNEPTLREKFSAAIENLEPGPLKTILALVLPLMSEEILRGLWQEVIGSVQEIEAGRGDALLDSFAKRGAPAELLKDLRGAMAPEIAPEPASGVRAGEPNGRHTDSQ